MSAEIVNLRLARKRKARDDEAKRADENRVRFGRTKAEKANNNQTVAALDRHLDGHRLTVPADDLDAKAGAAPASKPGK